MCALHRCHSLNRRRPRWRDGERIEAGGEVVAGQQRAHQAGGRRRAMPIMPARKRPILEQLAVQDTQRLCVVDIVPCRQQMDGKPDLGGTHERLLRNLIGAPRHVLEQAAVTRLEAEQIIAAIGRGPEHGAIPGMRQHLRGLHQQRRRQGGTVGVQNDGACMPERQELIDGGIEAVAEIRPPGFEQRDLARQRVPEERDGLWARAGHTPCRAGCAGPSPPRECWR